MISWAGRSPRLANRAGIGAVIGRDRAEVEPRDQLLDALRPPQVRWQDLAGELDRVAVFIDRPAVDSDRSPAEQKMQIGWQSG